MVGAMRVGILTGGGDCPGLNAVIRAVVRNGAVRHNHEHLGLRKGWLGLLERDTMPLNFETTTGILHRGGTILRSSRTNPYSREGGPEAVMESMEALGLDALVAIGGEDTLGVAARLHADFGCHVVGVPKTIDNDLSGTDFTFGFWTAVQIAVDAIDRLHTTAESHDRIMVAEVMGRHAGWIAMESGLAGGADYILIPEVPTSIETVCEHIANRDKRGQRFSVIVVSEGVEFTDDTSEAELDEFGHKQLAKQGVGERLAEGITRITGRECRATVLGHIQRGGTPTAFDRVLATRCGIHATEMVAAGLWGRMAALRGEHVVNIPLEEAVGTLKTVPEKRFRGAEVFFG